ncbi:MAG: system P-loop protein BrxC, partial [Patescibacteria group bacterium]|nr:system P-loop protein BrxC [Patescibacteria group bacterium]
RERIDNKLVGTVQSLARDLFNTTAFGDTEDDMADSLRREIDAKLEATTSYLQKYNYQSYPGKPVVENVNAALRELKQIRDTKDLFDAFSTKQADLIAKFDAFKPVVSFFEHQVAIFDRAARAIKDYDFVSSSITVSSPEVAEMRDILALDAPYDDIPKLAPLTTALEQAVSKGHAELQKRADEARKLDEERRKAIADQQEAKERGETPAEAPKIAKPVRSGDLINRTYSLKSEADVDAMLSELRQRLLQELADNGEVKVI